MCVRDAPAFADCRHGPKLEHIVRGRSSVEVAVVCVQCVHTLMACRYALGSMIYEANALGWQFEPTPPHTSQMYYYLFIGFVSLSGLLAFVTIFMFWCVPRPGAVCALRCLLNVSVTVCRFVSIRPATTRGKPSNAKMSELLLASP